MSRQILVPTRNDRVCDKLGEVARWGTVTQTIYIEDEPFVVVRFDDGEEMQYERESFFTQENCGHGRWDEQQNCWMIEPSGDELPKDHPFNIQLGQMFENMNVQLLKERLRDNYNLEPAALKAKADEALAEANNLGKHHPYYNFYKSKSDDYLMAIEYKAKRL